MTAEKVINPLCGTMRHALAFVLLAAITLFAFQGVRHCDFINFDDDVYVYENRSIRDGLTWQSVRGAFQSDFFVKTTQSECWQPATWLSHMLDIHLFGLNAGMHHVVNLGFHLASTLILFHVLNRMTGKMGRSWMVAALFGVHPLQVEAVAWVTARKDMLSGFFWMMTIWMYIRYAARPSVMRYFWVALMLALGLMSKPMGITLPFILLLLDYWPLGRLRDEFPSQRSSMPLVLEKIPLFALSVFSFLLALHAKSEHLSVKTPINMLANVADGYGNYLLKAFWPARLAVWYSCSADRFPAGPAIASGAILLIVTLVVWNQRPVRKYLLVGWLWFLGALVPVIDLQNVSGGDAIFMADRYSYLPIIGLFIMVSWVVPDVLGLFLWGRRAMPILAAATLSACVVLSTRQVGYWRNSYTLFQHTIEVTKNNTLAHLNLGAYCMKLGRMDEADGHFRECLLIQPDYAKALLNHGVVLASKGQLEEAARHFHRALEIKPELGDVHNNLGTLMVQQGKLKSALMYYRQALKISPDYPRAHLNLANTLLLMRNVDEAVPHYERSIFLYPNSIQPHYKLALCMMLQGRQDAFFEQLNILAQLDPKMDWKQQLAGDYAEFNKAAPSPASKNSKPAHPRSQ